MLYYPYKTMFSAYKSVIVSPCACDLFVNKVMKITWYMDVRFWQSFFGAFSVCWLYLEINQSLVAEIICTIYSFIHASTQHNILNKTSFQQCFIFNWSEVHNPLHAHLLALSHIYIYEWMNENLYIAHKKLPHKTLHVHSARYTQCIHVSSRKLKPPKDMHSYQKVQTATHPSLSKSVTIHKQLNVKIYTELQIMITEKRNTQSQSNYGNINFT